jgi:CRISPR-associated protein Cmr2
MGEAAVEGNVAGRDLVVLALPGVQRFIAEARSTADVAAASEIYATLAACAANSLMTWPGAEPVLPAPPARTQAVPLTDVPGVPNRVVVLIPAGDGREAAEQAAGAVRKAWDGYVRELFPAGDKTTPGFPDVQWACVPASDDGYPAQWDRVQRLLAARRLVRSFQPVPDQEWRQRTLCSLAPRWPAEPELPSGLKEHERRMPLSAVGWVKRRWLSQPGRRRAGFPSTPSIASAPYRRAALSHWADAGIREAAEDLARCEQQLRHALGLHGQEAPVPGLPGEPAGQAARWLAESGGPWVYEDRWRPQTLAREGTSDPARRAELERQITAPAAAGQRAAGRLAGAMDRLRRDDPAIPRLTGYLAVLVQDLDNMGRFLGGTATCAAGTRITVSPQDHERVSGELIAVAAVQARALEHGTPQAGTLHGVPVYAGGDDLLAFVPAATALAAAEACHALVPPSLPTASTAVLFFHYHMGLQQAMREARSLLDQAKHELWARRRDKHGLAVGYMRRSGTSAYSIQPWSAGGGSSAELFRLFGRQAQHRLSPRLVEDLERDADELASLRAVPGGYYRAELTRLVQRHLHREAGSGEAAAVARDIARALSLLGEYQPRPGRQDDQPDRDPRQRSAARVGVFLRQEAR